MNHFRARRHLAAIPDHMLAAGLEARVLAHARRCPSCRRTLHEHRAAEGLLASIPAALIPLGSGAAAERRLQGLIRWAPEPVRPVGRWRAPALGAIAAIVAVMLELSVTLPLTRPSTASDPWIEVAALPSGLEAAGGMAGWR